jgi:hypothetical protein
MRYHVTELRAFEVEYVIDADSEQDAKALNGTIIEEVEHESYGYEHLGTYEVEDDFEL